MGCIDEVMAPRVRTQWQIGVGIAKVKSLIISPILEMR
jgi:hypothetical protein